MTSRDFRESASSAQQHGHDDLAAALYAEAEAMDAATPRLTVVRVVDVEPIG